MKTPAPDRRGDDQRHIAWPVERFYFAIVERSALPPSRFRTHRTEQVLFAAEPLLPVPIEEIHAAFAAATDGRVVICAVPCEALLDVPASALTLSPAELPSFLPEVVAPEQFNLLTGLYEPRQVRRLRRLSNGALVCAIALIALLVCFGFARRTSDLRESAAAHEVAVYTVVERVIEPAHAQSHSTQQLFLRLTAELRGLRQTRSTDVVDPELFDAPGSLAAVLAHWPSDIIVRTESLSVTRSTITLRANVASSADVQRLADALSDNPGAGAGAGWTLQQPRVNSTRDGVACTITFVRSERQP
jgi:hypothetical protein